MRGIPVILGGLVLAFLLLGGIECDDGNRSTGAAYDYGWSTGNLRARNEQLMAAQQAAAARLAAERSRSAKLTDEINTRNHVEALLVGVVVLTGCALAAAFFILLRGRRAGP